MVFVTLTTDYGLRDHYLAALKGSILQEEPALRLIDISHNVQNYNIVQAAYLFSNAWEAFPERTIHLVSVNDFDQKKPQILGLKYRNHFFLGPDNGIFSLVFEDLPQLCHIHPISLRHPHPLRTAYSAAVGHIARQGSLAGWGRQTDQIVHRLSLQPVISKTMIQGNVIYIDQYDNAITNIRQDLFKKVGEGRRFSLFFKRNDPIRRLVDHYHEAPLGSPLCRFNSAGYLEVAINKGKAVTLLSLSVEDTVQVVFENRRKSKSS